jgi:DNA-binding transcriptional ArsR family regulator
VDGLIHRFDEAAFFAQNETLALRELKVGLPFGVGLQACAINLVCGETRKRDQSPGDVIGTFVRQKVADEVAAAGGDDPSPIHRIPLEGGALKGVNLVADQAGKVHVATIPVASAEWFVYDRTMSDGPNIARIAALVGDPARAEMLTALLGGRALTATELSGVAGITKQTASAHLSKLLEARLLTMQSQGRHRYFQLADADVAHLLESLMGVAHRAGAVRLRSGPREPALRNARQCYDHLAGDKGVQLFDSLVQRGLFKPASGTLELSGSGANFFHDFGIDVDLLEKRRRPLCRSCLDWSARRHHLGGALGAAMLQRIFALGWARRARYSRAVIFSAGGEMAFRRRFGDILGPARPAGNMRDT